MRLDTNEVYRSRGKNDARCYPNNIEWISSSFSWLVNDAVRWMPCSCQVIFLYLTKLLEKGLISFTCPRSSSSCGYMIIFILSLQYTKREKANSLYGPLCAYKFLCTRMHDISFYYLITNKTPFG